MKSIPFYPNHPDGTHCYQAALGMVLETFTKKRWSFETLDRLTGKLKDKWTWPTTSLLWLLDHHFEVKLIEEFSYETFGKEGRNYLADKWGEEVARAQETNSDLLREQKLALKLSKRISIDFRAPTWEDLSQLFQDNYLTICNINSNLLFGQQGYSGHFIVPINILENEIVIHDPGLPPKPSLKVTRAIFEAAWGFPTEREKNAMAIRPKKLPLDSKDGGA